MTLDKRIAEALASKDTARDTFAQLYRKSFDAITAAKATIESETTRAEDIANANPDASFDLIKKAELQIKRLSKAIPRLRDRVEVIDRRNYLAQWHTLADQLELERDSLASELREIYPAIITQLSDLFGRIDANTAGINSLHSQAPDSEPRRLIDAELAARGLTHYTAEQPRLRDSLLLPDFTRPHVTYPPKYDFSAQAALSAQGLLQALAQKHALTCNADWWQAKQLQDEQQRAEFAAREQQLAGEKAESKQRYEQAVQEADRRRQGFLNGGNGGG